MKTEDAAILIDLHHGFQILDYSNSSIPLEIEYLTERFYQSDPTI